MSEEYSKITKADGKIYDIKKVSTWDVWRERSIIASWEIDGWKHVTTKEYRNEKETNLAIYFERLAAENE
jgi:hypothetical protein